MFENSDFTRFSSVELGSRLPSMSALAVTGSVSAHLSPPHVDEYTWNIQGSFAAVCVLDARWVRGEHPLM